MSTPLKVLSLSLLSTVCASWVHRVGWLCALLMWLLPLLHQGLCVATLLHSPGTRGPGTALHLLHTAVAATAAVLTGVEALAMSMGLSWGVYLLPRVVLWVALLAMLPWKLRWRMDPSVVTAGVPSIWYFAAPWTRHPPISICCAVGLGVATVLFSESLARNKVARDFNAILQAKYAAQGDHVPSPPTPSSAGIAPSTPVPESLCWANLVFLFAALEWLVFMGPEEGFIYRVETMVFTSIALILQWIIHSRWLGICRDVAAFSDDQQCAKLMQQQRRRFLTFWAAAGLFTFRDGQGRSVVDLALSTGKKETAIALLEMGIGGLSVPAKTPEAEAIAEGDADAAPSSPGTRNSNKRKRK